MNQDRGFRPARRFGTQFEERGNFDNKSRESPNQNSPSPGGFDRRKRFPRDNRIRGDEDPSFE